MHESGSCRGISNIIWTPNPGPQTVFVQCPYTEVLYGGAKGGGKSAGLLGDFAQGIEQYGEQWIGVIIRKTFPELMEIELQAERIFGPHYGFNNYKRGEHKWILPSQNKGNSILYLKSMEDSRDKMKVHGYSLTWAGVDEATLWPDDEIPEYLLTCMRSVKGVKSFLRLTSNPGGPGHEVIKARYKIGMIPDGTPIRTFCCECRQGRVEFITINGKEQVDRCRECGSDRPDPGDPGHTKVFIPAKVTDNKALMENDPGYYYRLQAIADPVMRRAYLYGDWDIAQGAAFPEFNKDVHVISTYAVPKGARVWRTMDWGYDKPFACYWITMNANGQLILCREYYGGGLKPNHGIRLDPEVVADRIRDIETANGWDVKIAYLDPQCWAEHGAEDIFRLLGGHKMRWRKWRKVDRTNKKNIFHSFLKTINGNPRLLVMDSCQHFIRTIASLQTDPHNNEDVATGMEDHAYDAVAGFLVSENIPAPEVVKRQHEQAWLTQFDTEPSGEVRFGGW